MLSHTTVHRVQHPTSKSVLVITEFKTSYWVFLYLFNTVVVCGVRFVARHFIESRLSSKEQKQGL